MNKVSLISQLLLKHCNAIKWRENGEFTYGKPCFLDISPEKVSHASRFCLKLSYFLLWSQTFLMKFFQEWIMKFFQEWIILLTILLTMSLLKHSTHTVQKQFYFSWGVLCIKQSCYLQRNYLSLLCTKTANYEQ